MPGDEGSALIYKLGGMHRLNSLHVHERFMVIGVYNSGQKPSVFTKISKDINKWIKEQVDGTQDAMCNIFNSCICGKRIKLNENRIIPPSNDAKLGEYPWMVYIHLTFAYGMRAICGGTLLTSKHVITASHCLGKGSNRKKNTHSPLVC